MNRAAKREEEVEETGRIIKGEENREEWREYEEKRVEKTGGG